MTEVASPSNCSQYEQRMGVQQDFEEAARWYRLSAEQGNATATRNLGLLYDRRLLDQ